jgi:cytochrome bd ubiquinol oxidase subunit I
VRTGSEEWKRLTKFWMKLFGINFVIGVATGIILEFQFGTNWSNYSWMVGDIFGAPLAIEGIVAFFLEATFFVVMFFGWNRVSKGFHLFPPGWWRSAPTCRRCGSWWPTPGCSIRSARPSTRTPPAFEMQNFFEVAFSPYAVNKFTHATSSSMLVAALFVISISSWYLLRGRHVLMAKRSIVVAATLGLLASVFTIFNGDESAYEIAQVQPMKLAAFEGLYEGQKNAGLVALGIINRRKRSTTPRSPLSAFNLTSPGFLS